MDRCSTNPGFLLSSVDVVAIASGSEHAVVVGGQV